MPDKSDLFQIPRPMRLIDAISVREMVKAHPEFSGVQVDINRDRETYKSIQSKSVPEGQVLVTLCIPREGVKMFDLFREMERTINQESLMVQGERER